MSKFTLLNPLKHPDSVLLSVNILVIVFSALLILAHKNFPPLIPLWFSQTWGLERLASPTYLWIIPGLGFIFLLINQFFAQLVRSERPVLARILVWTSFFITLILFFSTYRILLLSS